jgi:hypothetical protein
MVGISAPKSCIFTMKVDGRPTVVFEVGNWSQAKELSREEWFRANISLQMSGGVPLSVATSNYGARYALPAEVARFEQLREALGRAPDDLELVYLVDLDG